MQAKLAHAQAVLEGLALVDYAQIDTNAMALKRISLGGDWIPQQSPSYFEFSEEFRRVCDDLTNHAREQDLQALTSDYANLTNSCVACHTYLRMERQTSNFPGKMSFNLGHD
jgi:cytochrome c556